MTFRLHRPHAPKRGAGDLVEEPLALLGAPSLQQPHHDLYHFLLAVSWPKFFVLVIMVYLGSNLLFALAYLACGPGAISNAVPGSLLDAFFFSIQTMATIGYGKLTPVGTLANFIVSFEALFGIVYASITTGLAFARFTRPTAGVRFSRVAVIGSHDGRPALKFRLANERRSQIIEAGVRLWLVREVSTLEGEHYRRPVELKLLRAHSPVFALSWTVIHLVDKDSPFCGVSVDTAAQESWQLLVTFSGYHENFANQVYARHVYDASDLRFGANFADMVAEGGPDGRLIDLKKFDQWLPAAESSANTEKNLSVSRKPFASSSTP